MVVSPASRLYPKFESVTKSNVCFIYQDNTTSPAKLLKTGNYENPRNGKMDIDLANLSSSLLLHCRKFYDMRSASKVFDEMSERALLHIYLNDVMGVCATEEMSESAKDNMVGKFRNTILDFCCEVGKCINVVAVFCIFSGNARAPRDWNNLVNTIPNLCCEVIFQLSDMDTFPLEPDHHPVPPELVAEPVESLLHPVTRFSINCSLLFHGLPDLDGKNQRCRKQLVDHNARRHKPHQEMIRFNSRSMASSYYGTFIPS
ncbi:squamosa promoter-binding-like protein 12 [Tanacetum coccineum]|uniref:Squamosa promoter-binding-like protein 12 n=1 Tax=Tanacetum coccineum TaxID=301880 RepID=A0ABQ5HK89_9ASTR